MPLSKNVHILRAVWITALTVALLAATPHAARAQLTVGAPTATFGPGPALTGFSVTVGIKSAGPLSPGDSVTLQCVVTLTWEIVAQVGTPSFEP